MDLFFRRTDMQDNTSSILEFRPIHFKGAGVSMELARLEDFEDLVNTWNRIGGGNWSYQLIVDSTGKIRESFKNGDRNDVI